MLRTARTVETLIIGIMAVLLVFSLAPSEETTLAAAIAEMRIVSALDFRSYDAEVRTLLRRLNAELADRYRHAIRAAGPVGVADDWGVGVPYSAERVDNSLPLRDLRRVLEDGPAIVYYIVEPEAVENVWKDIQRRAASARTLSATIILKWIRFEPVDKAGIDALADGYSRLPQPKQFEIQTEVQLVTDLISDGPVQQLPFAFGTRFAFPMSVQSREAVGVLERLNPNVWNLLFTKTDTGRQRALSNTDPYWNLVQDANASEALKLLQARQEAARHSLAVGGVTVPYEGILRLTPALLAALFFYLIACLWSAQFEDLSRNDSERIAWLSLQPNRVALASAAIVFLIAPFASVWLLFYRRGSATDMPLGWLMSLLIAALGIGAFLMMLSIRRRIHAPKPRPSGNLYE
jgi:hypothetical protein